MMEACFTACWTAVVVTSPDLESHCAKGTCYTSREQCNTAMSACWSPKVVEKLLLGVATMYRPCSCLSGVRLSSIRYYRTLVNQNMGASLR